MILFSIVLGAFSSQGGAWDNAKKFIEQKLSDDPELRKGKVIRWQNTKIGCSAFFPNIITQRRQGTDVHKAAVVGDTVGDPLKDTSGPALNILMKLMAILRWVITDSESHQI